MGRTLNLEILHEKVMATKKAMLKNSSCILRTGAQRGIFIRASQVCRTGGQRRQAPLKNCSTWRMSGEGPKMSLENSGRSHQLASQRLWRRPGWRKARTSLISAEVWLVSTCGRLVLHSWLAEVLWNGKVMSMASAKNQKLSSSASRHRASQAGPRWKKGED